MKVFGITNIFDLFRIFAIQISILGLKRVLWMVSKLMLLKYTRLLNDLELLSVC